MGSVKRHKLGGHSDADPDAGCNLPQGGLRRNAPTRDERRGHATGRRQHRRTPLPADPGPDERARPGPARHALPTIDHRGPEFAALGSEVLEAVKAPFGTSQPVVIYPSSGTGAWEAALVNTLSPGDRVLASRPATSPRCGRRWPTELGLEVEFVPGDWRHGVDPEAVAERLAADTGHEIKAVMVVHNETSTGVTSRVAEVREAIDAAGHPALLLVDTISSLGCIDYRHDEWGVDVTVAGSQKGLMLPPGLSFNAVSEKALAGVEDGAAAALLLGLAADPRGQRPRLLAVHAGHEPALRPARGAADAGTRRAWRTSSPATSATPRRPAPPCAAGVWRCSRSTSASTPAR